MHSSGWKESRFGHAALSSFIMCIDTNSNVQFEGNWLSIKSMVMLLQVCCLLTGHQYVGIFGYMDEQGYAPWLLCPYAHTIFLFIYLSK